MRKVLTREKAPYPTHPPCIVRGCDEPGDAAKGLCWTCYRRDARARKRKPRRGGLCGYPTCDRKPDRRGLCNGHAQQLYRGEIIRPIVRRSRLTRSVRSRAAACR